MLQLDIKARCGTYHEVLNEVIVAALKHGISFAAVLANTVTLRCGNATVQATA